MTDLMVVAVLIFGAHPYAVAAKSENPKKEWRKWYDLKTKNMKENTRSPFTLWDIGHLRKGHELHVLKDERGYRWTYLAGRAPIDVSVLWKNESSVTLTSNNVTTELEFNKDWSKDQFIIAIGAPEKNGDVRIYLHDRERNTFTRFNFFEYDTSYRVQAKLEKSAPKVLQLKTVDDRTVDAFEIGKLKFAIGSSSSELTAYVFGDPSSLELFIPFKDRTSAKETYGAGRFLELELASKDAKTVMLDFNYATNPYCAYHSAYSCILPPHENVLNVAIHAGEKKYHP